MIVSHRWCNDGTCSRCGAGKRQNGARTQYRAEGAQWWGDTIGDCRGDLSAPFRVVKQITLHGRTTNHVTVMYRGTLVNCRTWLRDHKKLMGSLEVIDGFYWIEQKEGSAWARVSSSRGAKVTPQEKPSTPYTTRQQAEEELGAHFAKHPGDNAEYTIIQVYARG